jgi:uncharacterized phiE125 gp8 family phage protein
MNNYAIKTITAATDYPIDNTEAKAHMAIDDSTFDMQINDFITAATAYIENRTGRQICTATLELRFDKFPVGRIYLPKGQLQSVTSVKYIDTAGVEQTVTSTDYLVSDSREPAFVEPAYGKNWPIARDESDAIRVRFVCGYGDSSVTPRAISQAALLLVAHMFEHREAVVFNASPQEVPMAVEALINQYRLGDDYVWYDQAD